MLLFFHVPYQNIYSKEKYIHDIQYKGIFLLLGDRQTEMMERGKERKVFEAKHVLFCPSCVLH